MTAKVLSWFALIAAVTFICLAPGRRLHPELLSFPLIALAVAQILNCRKQSKDDADPCAGLPLLAGQ